MYTHGQRNTTAEIQTLYNKRCCAFDRVCVCCVVLTPLSGYIIFTCLYRWQLCEMIPLWISVNIFC
jgi:hypothetical protein